MPFERRGARFDDYVTAMKKVWSGELVEHEGEFVRFHNFKSYPLPPQRPHPPIIIGGTSRAAFARVVKHGDGWFAPSVGRDGARQGSSRSCTKSRASSAAIPATIEITAMWPYALEGADSRNALRATWASRG